jgi:hypothetical protein
MDNLNIHALSCLYEAFEPDEARRLVARFEVHHTPKHGSWLNVAEIFLSTLSRQCLDQRVGSIGEIRSTIADWQASRPSAKVRWRFTTNDARIKLRRLYPSIPWIRGTSVMIHRLVPSAHRRRCTTRVWVGVLGLVATSMASDCADADATGRGSQFPATSLPCPTAITRRRLGTASVTTTSAIPSSTRPTTSMGPLTLRTSTVRQPTPYRSRR